MQKARKVTGREFARYFLRCKPPAGWGKRIGVAYSGGVDSTCLLFLLKRFLQKSSDPTLRSLPILAIHVDHNLRPASHKDAEHCKDWAQKHSIPIKVETVAWGNHPFPSHTQPGFNSKKELYARNARYRAIFNIMKANDVDVLLMAHHLDDQLETAILRRNRSQLGKAGKRQVTPIGLAGMRHCRRWGMGDPWSGIYGLEGMSRWICRPLLNITKKRLVQTAQDERLEFVQDETNEDHRMTERNRIRALLTTGERNFGLVRAQNPLRPPPDPLQPSSTSLYNFVQEYNALRDDVDHAVDEYLLNHMGDSPVGTYHLITSNGLPPPLVVRHAVVLRILRYVSPFPWGSPDAEAHRQLASLTQITNALWPYETQAELDRFLQLDLAKPRRRFAAGGLVLWQPTPTLGIPITQRTSQIVAKNSAMVASRTSFGWLAQRQPPYNRKYRDHSPNEITIDITAQLFSRKPFRLVWDLRWLLEFPEGAIDLLCKDRFKKAEYREIPPTGEHLRYLITPANQWWQPAVVLADLCYGGEKKTDLQEYTREAKWRPTAKNVHLALPSVTRPHPGVKMTFIRTIDVI
ncbi:hypothetical protein FRB91_011139 [Serendipita sp. 411]|nr:hypothetical protein FRB91_011139 [Serendipita sp. 411]